MINDVTYCIMQIFSVVFIWMLVDRICKCFEYCSLQKSLSNAYSRMNSNWLDDIVKKKLGEKKET